MSASRGFYRCILQMSSLHSTDGISRPNAHMLKSVAGIPPLGPAWAGMAWGDSAGMANRIVFVIASGKQRLARAHPACAMTKGSYGAGQATYSSARPILPATAWVSVENVQPPFSRAPTPSSTPQATGSPVSGQRVKQAACSTAPNTAVNALAEGALFTRDHKKWPRCEVRTPAPALTVQSPARWAKSRKWPPPTATAKLSHPYSAHSRRTSITATGGPW